MLQEHIYIVYNNNNGNNNNNNNNNWSNKTKLAIQLGYANRIIYSNISKEKNEIHLRN